MNAPTEVFEPVVEIIKTGLLNIRVYASSGDALRCEIEADHVHNLPGLLRNFSPKLLRFYLDVEQPIFVKKAKGIGLAPFESSWEKLKLYSQRTAE